MSNLTIRKRKTKILYIYTKYRNEQENPQENEERSLYRKKQSKTNQAASAKKHISKGMIITQTIMNSN